MNPWAVILALIAIACLVVAYEGTQDNVFAAVTGKAATPKSTATSTTPGTTGVTLA